MEFTKFTGTDFRVFELFYSGGAKITVGKTVELRIFRVVEGGTWQIYDWNDKTFKNGPTGDDEDNCTHQTVDNAAYDTGIWQNDRDIDVDAFVVGDLYVFEFWNATDGEMVAAPSLIQWGGNYGQLAITSDVTTSGATTDALIAGLNNLSSGQAEAACDAALVSTNVLINAVGGLVAGLNDVSAAQVEAACEAALVSTDALISGLNNITAGDVVTALEANDNWKKIRAFCCGNVVITPAGEWQFWNEANDAIMHKFTPTSTGRVVT